MHTMYICVAAANYEHSHNFDKTPKCKLIETWCNRDASYKFH